MYSPRFGSFTSGDKVKLSMSMHYGCAACTPNYSICESMFNGEISCNITSQCWHIIILLYIGSVDLVEAITHQDPLCPHPPENKMKLRSVSLYVF